MEWIKEGRVLPEQGSLNWKKFLRAWRQWFATACKTEDTELNAKNTYYYDIGKEHIKNQGIGVTEILHTGSVALSIPKDFGKEKTSSPIYSYEIQ